MTTVDFKWRRVAYVPADFRPAASHPEAREPFYGSIVNIVARMLKLQGIKLYVEGAEKVPASGPALLAFNHTGYFDFILGGVPAKLNGNRLVRYMAKREIFDTPVVGSIMRKMGHISVDRDAGAQSLDDATAELADGKLVGIFPEATISRSFEIKDIKTGAARIAQQAQVPLIPVAIWGSQRIWTKDLPKKLLRPKVPVWIRVGEPLELSGDPDADTAALRAKMSDMVTELRQDYANKFGPFPSGSPWIPAAMGGGAPTPDRARLLTMEERERRQAAKAKKREEKLRRLDERDDRRAMDVLWARGWFGRMRARVLEFINHRRGH